MRIGLTGGIASGKSTVSARFAELGAVVVDADLLARDVVRPGSPGLVAVVSEFGADVLSGTGELDRRALAKRVFDDDDARRRLEAIIHPLVRQRAAELEASAPEGAVVVHDIPLLVETGRESDFDVVVVVDADDDLRIRRLQHERRMSAAEAAARIAAQATRERRLAAADYVIVNNGTIDELHTEVDHVWSALRHPPVLD